MCRLGGIGFAKLPLSVQDVLASIARLWREGREKSLGKILCQRVSADSNGLLLHCTDSMLPTGNQPKKITCTKTGSLMQT